MGSLAPNVSGISKDSWEEVIEVFGHGDEYAWAMDEDEEPLEDMELDGEGGQPSTKATVRLRDIFEPSELKERMLTDADEAIRILDVPERTQLMSANSGLSISAEPLLDENEINEAAEWLSKRISDRCTNEFMTPDQSGFMPILHPDFLAALKQVITFFMVDFLEVPFVWSHRRDYINHYDPYHYDPNQRTKYFLTRDDLWKVYALSFKFRALIERKRGLKRLYDKLNLADPDNYFLDTFHAVDSVEEAADLTQWLRTQYASEFRSAQADWQESDDLAAGLGPEAEIALGVAKSVRPTKFKKAARDSRYERAIESPIKQLASDIGIAAHELAADFTGGNKTHFSEDQEMLPLDWADRYANDETEFSDAAKALEGASFTSLGPSVGSG